MDRAASPHDGIACSGILALSQATRRRAWSSRSLLATLANAFYASRLLVHAFQDRIQERNDLVGVGYADVLVDYIRVSCFVPGEADLMGSLLHCFADVASSMERVDLRSEVSCCDSFVLGDSLDSGASHGHSGSWCTNSRALVRLDCHSGDVIRYVREFWWYRFWPQAEVFVFVLWSDS